MSKGQTAVSTKPASTGVSRNAVFWLALVLMVGFLLYSSRTVPAAFTWKTDFDAALAEAGQSGRPVLLAFYMPACGACRWMDREVFAKQDVARAVRDWVPVHIDGTAETRLANQYGIEAFPTFVLLSSSGQVIETRMGPLTAEEFIAFLESAGKPQTAPASQPR